MSFANNNCGGCYSTYEFYRHANVVPPCPRCGYPLGQGQRRRVGAPLGVDLKHPRQG